MRISKETWLTSVPMKMLGAMVLGVVLESAVNGYHRNPVLDTLAIVIFVSSNYFWSEYKVRHTPKGDAEQPNSSA